MKALHTDDRNCRNGRKYTLLCRSPELVPTSIYAKNLRSTVVFLFFLSFRRTTAVEICRVTAPPPVPPLSRLTFLFTTRRSAVYAQVEHMIFPSELLQTHGVLHQPPDHPAATSTKSGHLDTNRSDGIFHHGKKSSKNTFILCWNRSGPWAQGSCIAKYLR